MRITLIIPTLDEASLADTLASRLSRLQAHEGGALEVLVVDGGSQDGTPEHLRARGVRVLDSGPGRALQMNAGAAAATGDVLLFLHADTELPREGLASLRTAVQNGADAGFFAVDLDSDRPLLRVVGRCISWRSRLTRGAGGDQGLFVTRRAFTTIGGFAAIPLFEDLDLCRRLRRQHRVAALRPRVVTSARRWEERGPWRTILEMWGLRLLYDLGVRPGVLGRWYPAVR